MIIQKHKYFFSLIFSCFVSYGAQQIVGDKHEDEEGFSFPIGTSSFYMPEGRFFIGAAEAKENNEFAIAAADRARSTFFPLAPKMVTLNGVSGILNPLYGAAITHAVMLGMRPLFVKKGSSAIYVVDHFSHENNIKNPIEVIASDPIANAKGYKHAPILGVTTSAPSLQEHLDGGYKAELAAFVALANASGTFDGNGSGIALLFFKSQTQDNATEFFWDILDARTGDSQFKLLELNEQPKQLYKKLSMPNDDIKKKKPLRERSLKGNYAVPIGITTAALKINSDLSGIDPIVDMFYDRDLGRLYVALSVYAGENAHDGARAIMVGQVVQGKLLFTPIVPDSAFEQDDALIGGCGSRAHIAIHKVRTMQTKTYLRYLVVVGGNSSKVATRRSVYALPLVENSASSDHGKLADVTAHPITLFLDRAPFSFQTRLFAKAAKAPQELYTVSSPQAQVGGSVELPGDISDIHISSDAIFVSTEENDEIAAGIFHSQALFDGEGRIVGWTNWKRVAGAAQKTRGFAYDSYTGEFWSIIHNARNVIRTQWSQGLLPIEQYIAEEFKKEDGGVQGLFDFPYTTQGFASYRGSRLSLLAYTGFNKVLLLQSGCDTKYGFAPLSFHKETIRSLEKGTLAGFVEGSTGLALSGGALQDISPITTVTVVVDESYGWFVIGGSQGLAILTHTDGSGWDAQQGLQSGFKGLSSAMIIKKIGAYKNIRKIVSVGNSLYILTPTTLDRIIISAQIISSDNIEAVTLARTTRELLTSVSSFSDIIISGPLVLLATSEGLLRSGNNVDIRTVSKESDVHWTKVPLNETVGSLTCEGPISRLYAISATGYEQDVAQGGNVYVLNAYVGTSQAQVYRLWIQVQSQVTDSTITLFPDYFVKDTKTFFVDLGEYRNFIATDGALMTASRSAYGDKIGLLELLPSHLKSGHRFGARGSISVKFLSKDKRACCVGQMLRDSASGAWLLPGDFGIRVQG